MLEQLDRAHLYTSRAQMPLRVLPPAMLRKLNSNMHPAARQPRSKGSTQLCIQNAARKSALLAHTRVLEVRVGRESANTCFGNSAYTLSSTDGSQPQPLLAGAFCTRSQLGKISAPCTFTDNR
jgi:hypothetical protein